MIFRFTAWASTWREMSRTTLSGTPAARSALMLREMIFLDRLASALAAVEDPEVALEAADHRVHLGRQRDSGVVPGCRTDSAPDRELELLEQAVRDHLVARETRAAGALLELAVLGDLPFEQLSRLAATPAAPCDRERGQEPGGLHRVGDRERRRRRAADHHRRFGERESARALEDPGPLEAGRDRGSRAQ